MSQQQSERPVCHRVDAVKTGYHIEVEVPRYARLASGMAAEVKAVQSYLRDIVDILKDHRSIDPPSFNMVYETVDQCSCCECDWEPWIDDDGKLSCAGCGAEVTDAADSETA